VAIAPPRLDSATSAEILELARVAAHTQERRFAPLAAYLAGMAAAGGPLDPAALIRSVREELEAAAG
jgi:hypothetical protein